MTGSKPPVRTDTQRYRVCVVIPVYNHHRAIAGIVEHLQAKIEACILVDDGSDADCRNVLQAIARNNKGVTLIRLAKNSGKGAAVRRGLQCAAQSGFTHALQVDADGQHNLEDVPRLLALSRAYPDCVISGSRSYKSAPRGRRYGRMLTDVWVWINTLSFEIKDAMCGFRVYPVDKVAAIIDTQPVGNRMDFDVEIFVRLYWEDIHVKYVETTVLYGEDMVSHFKSVIDNVLITWMHTRLFFGMLRRLPKLLWRKMSAD